MTSVNQLRREVEIVRRALGVGEKDYQKEAEEANRLFSEYERALEEATVDMTVEEKTKFQHDQAKQVARDYAEGKIS